ncbi:hypothetical protein [Burkholderia sp. BCC1630]|nr:hypothetical protein [Burkholderia sp. BCC1630]
MRAAISLATAGITNLAHACCTRRDWHPLVGLVVLYLIASAVAPVIGV